MKFAIESVYLRFAQKRFALPTERAVADLEARIKVPLPVDYREFVLSFNGGYFNEPEIMPVGEGCPRGDALRSLFGIGASHPTAELGSLETILLFDDNFPPIILPIGETSLGALIVMLMDTENRGAIVFKEAFGTFHYLADGIEHFFSLLQTPSWSVGTS